MSETTSAKPEKFTPESDKKARFALVIMSVLNAVAVLLAQNSR